MIFKIFWIEFQINESRYLFNLDRLHNIDKQNRFLILKILRQKHKTKVRVMGIKAFL